MPTLQFIPSNNIIKVLDTQGGPEVYLTLLKFANIRRSVNTNILKRVLFKIITFLQYGI